MATFDILEHEGVRFVRARIKNETIRTESGALYFMRGRIDMESKAPSMGGLFKSLATGEAVFRPTYTGTGDVYLEPWLGGYHVLELDGEQEWVLEGGSYWASEEGVQLDIHREKALTAFKSGEGFLNFQTKVSGVGKVVLKAQGPVQVVQLKNDRLVVDGKYVLGRSTGIDYTVTRSSKSLLGSLSSGEGLVSTYQGTGTVLMAPLPYWRLNLLSTIAAAAAPAKK